MKKSVKLEIPEEMYEILTRMARQESVAPEQIILELISTECKRYQTDPIEQFVGSYDGPPSDWCDNHDQYLAEDSLDPHVDHSEHRN